MSLRKAKVMAVALLVLAGTASAKKPAQVDAGPKPELPAAPVWQAPAPELKPLASGLRVVTLEQHELPLVHIVVMVQAGAELDPPGKAGLAAAVGDMLQEGGAGSMTGPELSAAFEALGDQLKIITDRDSTAVSVTVQKRDQARALELIADLLAHPRFDPAEWTRFHAQRLAEVLHRRDEPRFVADEVFDRVMFGAHPYGSPVLGTAASLGKLSLDDVKAFYQAHFGPRTSALLRVGDVDAKADAGPLAAWSSPAQPAAVPHDPPAPPARFVLVNRPGAPQSELRVGHLGQARATPDYAPMALLEMVLGGSFTSRLNQNLREKHGYTYGVRARFELDNARGPFVVQTAVRTDVTAPSLHEIVSELHGIQAPLSAEDLSKARALVLDGLIEGFGDGHSASELLADVVRHGLPLDSYRALPAKLAALEVPALTEKAKTLFAPDQLVIVVVGDRKTITPALKDLPFARAVELRDADGNLVEAGTKLHPLPGKPPAKTPPKPPAKAPPAHK